MNFFIVEQVPTLPPDTYDKPCPWDRRTTLESWISQRVLKLTCTAEDMLPLADACDFTGGSFQAEYGGRLNKWDEAERAELMAELDAAFFHLYGIARDDVEYILSTFKGIHDQQTLFPARSSIAQRIVQKYAEMSSPRRTRAEGRGVKVVTLLECGDSSPLSVRGRGHRATHYGGKKAAINRRTPK